MIDLNKLMADYDFPEAYGERIAQRIMEDGQALSDFRDGLFDRAGEEWMTTLDATPKATVSKTRRGTWANMTDEEVHAEMKRRSVKRLATIAAKKAART